MKNLKLRLIRKTASVIAFAVFSLVFTVTAFSQSNVPDTARSVLGYGYDLTGHYARPAEIKFQVLDLDRLIAEGRVLRNPNLVDAEFKTVTGSNISEYTSSLTNQTGRTISGGANVLSLSASFSREASTRFGSERVSQQEFEFATMSSVITTNAFFIRNQNLTPYIDRSFINDVNSMTPEQIISRYGTHVMLGALLGARLDYNMSIRKTSQTGSTNIDNLVTTSFDVRFRGMGGGANHNQELQSRFGSMYDISSMRTDTRAVGGRPQYAQSVHNSQDYNAWISSIEGNEVWSGYYPDTLIPLYEFIVQEHFGTRTQALRDALRSAIHRHLGVQAPVPAGFVRINGGTFMMGSPGSEPVRRDNEGPQRQVTVSSFNMGMYPVTQREYQGVMGNNPSNFRGDNLPVERVTWFDAIEYCIRRSQREGLTPAYTMTNRVPATGHPITSATVTWNRNANGYRLPTEAEWEYACRAGTTTPFNTGNNITTAQANYNGNFPYNNNARGTYRGRTTTVGSFSANAWGLHDMHGNVWEWCWDWFGSYAIGAQTDPTGAVSGTNRVLRGGSWSIDGSFLRSAYRDSNFPSVRYSFIGSRLVRP
ncbi:MAG: SUMF1/EgtB/PvdO family nonheme iron enzyme [Treponema sp.]|nr:SUMF1/EgtB/PvdO family nonheme iron enzyme [Treponema sp.]